MSFQVIALRGGEHRQGQAHGLAGQGGAQPKPPIEFGRDIEIA
jgi:hypothetical protein